MGKEQITILVSTVFFVILNYLETKKTNLDVDIDLDLD